MPTEEKTDAASSVLYDTSVLPCPFCGGQPIQDKTLRGGFEHDRDDADAWAYTIRCRSCAAEGGWAKNPAGAVRCWNMRATEDHYRLALRAAHEYLVALRQARYSGKPVVVDAATKRLDELASAYTAAAKTAGFM